MSRLEGFVGTGMLAGSAILIDRLDNTAATLIALALAVASAALYAFKVMK